MFETEIWRIESKKYLEIQILAPNFKTYITFGA